MATGQTLLNLMEVLNQELQLQSGEEDVARALVALNASQDLFEARLAGEAGTLGGQTGTLTTSSGVETTSFPTGLLRLDGLQLLDASTSRPSKVLDPIDGQGGYSPSFGWPWNHYLLTTSGSPSGYWTNGRLIYWSPLPDTTHTIRWYGLQAADDITADGTFAYPDVVILPLASLAVKILKSGVDDATEGIEGLALSAFEVVINTLAGFRRDGPQTLTYRYYHET